MQSLPIFFFFNAPPTTEIYTLSLHDALPISYASRSLRGDRRRGCRRTGGAQRRYALYRGGRESRYSAYRDRKSTRLNSSHSQISYAVFCLKKKKTTQTRNNT